MEEEAKKETSEKPKYRRPAFTTIDWIIAAASIALMVFILLNIPAF